MKFRVSMIELIVQNADPATSVQKIYAVSDQGMDHPAPQLMLSLSGPDIKPHMQKGDVFEVLV